MSFDFYMPDIGEGVVEGEIVAWKVKEGDTVKLDQVLVEVMTDKATVELPSPRAGVVKKINFKAGDICPVGKILVTIDDGNAASTSAPPPSHGASHGGGHTNTPVAAKSSGGGGQQIEVVDATATRERVLATPATRRRQAWPRHDRRRKELQAVVVLVFVRSGGGEVGIRADVDRKGWRRRAHPAAGHAQAHRRVDDAQQADRGALHVR